MRDVYRGTGIDRTSFVAHLISSGFPSRSPNRSPPPDRHVLNYEDWVGRHNARAYKSYTSSATSRAWLNDASTVRFIVQYDAGRLRPTGYGIYTSDDTRYPPRPHKGATQQHLPALAARARKSRSRRVTSRTCKRAISAASSSRILQPQQQRQYIIRLTNRQNKA